MANHTKMSMKCRASGGRVAYAGGNSNVAKEAKSTENFRGGGKVDGAKAKSRIKKARGGATSSPMSSAGGGGASKNPFSSAHRG